MKNNPIAQIVIAVFLALFWAGISWITNSNIGIYAGLACIYVMLTIKE